MRKFAETTRKHPIYIYMFIRSAKDCLQVHGVGKVLKSIFEEAPFETFERRIETFLASKSDRHQVQRFAAHDSKTAIIIWKDV
jgi:hypothetical protein